jgi:hypothetical protein
MIWNAARIFHGRRVLWSGMLAGAALWIAATTMTGWMQLAGSRMLLSSLIVSLFTLLTAAELWRERRKSVLQRWPAVFVPVLHAAVFLAPMGLATFMPLDTRRAFPAAGSPCSGSRSCCIWSEALSSSWCWRKSAVCAYFRMPFLRMS